jgi:glyoxylase-like metal-dependent hydrolase (beta-lactamase superfamily II)
MRITLLGASGGEVTGSAYLVETESANVLVDCGLFQGAKKLENRNRLPRPEAMRRLHSVVLTHAHLDHTGRGRRSRWIRASRRCGPPSRWSGGSARRATASASRFQNTVVPESDRRRWTVSPWIPARFR